MNKKLILVCVEVFLLVGMATACRTMTNNGELVADVAVPVEVSQIDADRNQPELDDTADANPATTVECARIVVEEAVYDFGVVVEGDIVSHTFLIENQGDGVLEITRTWSSCGCTTTTLADTTFEPGDIKRIVAKVNTSGFGGRAISKLITVESNDPENPVISLKMEGKVVSETSYLIDAEDLTGSLAFLVDVRLRQMYASGHLVGAVNLTADDAVIWFQVLPKDARVILYDQDGEVSPQLADQMLREGFMNVQVLIGGLDEWMRRYGDRMITTFPLIVGVITME